MTRQKLETTPVGVSTNECIVEMRKLIDYFRGEGYSSFGWDGDSRRWSPAETAINAMRELEKLRRRGVGKNAAPSNEEPK